MLAKSLLRFVLLWAVNFVESALLLITLSYGIKKVLDRRHATSTED